MKSLGAFLVQSIEHYESCYVKTFHFSFGMTPFEFYPGQFVTVEHPNYKNLTGALTLSSSPLDRNHFSLSVKDIGNFGSKFYSEVREGDVIDVSRPLGKFHIKSNEPDPVVFIARDYAVTAAYSAMKYLKDIKSNRYFFMIHEYSSEEECLFAEDFQRFADESAQTMYYIPCSALDSALASKIVNGIPYPASYYVAGEGVDVKRFMNLILQQGIAKERIHFERWS